MIFYLHKHAAFFQFLYLVDAAFSILETVLWSPMPIHDSRQYKINSR